MLYPASKFLTTLQTAALIALGSLQAAHSLENTDKNLFEICNSGYEHSKCLDECVDAVKTDRFSNYPDETARRIFVFFFQSFQSLLKDKVQSDSLIQNWESMLIRFKTAFPDDKLIPSLRLNYAAFLTEAGRTDSALAVYNDILSEFDPRTRFGSEALFYSGQLYYLKRDYRNALARYEDIRSTVFLPINRQELTIRKEESRFRLMEQELSGKDTAKAVDYIRQILRADLPPLFRDSILFHRSEIEYLYGDTSGSCASLDEIIQYQNKLHGIYYASLFNYALYKCPFVNMSPESEEKFYTRSREFIAHSGNPHRQSIITWILLDHILSSQNTDSLNKFLDNPFLKQNHPDSLKKMRLHILRNSYTPVFQNNALRRIKTSLSEDSLIPHPVFNNLKSEILLYEQFYNYLSDRAVSHQPGINPDILSAWEKSVFYFLKGIEFINEFNLKPEGNSPFIDSVMTCLTKVGELNSELAFSAAWEQIKFYISIAMKRSTKKETEYQQLGNILISSQYLTKAAVLIDKSEFWFSQLTRIDLHENTREVYSEILKQKVEVRHMLNVYWNEISRWFREMENKPVILRKEIAFELLVTKIEKIHRAMNPPTRPSITAVISSILAWNHLKTADNSADITQDSSWLIDHQARTGHRLNSFLAEMSGLSDTNLKADLGEVFINHINHQELTSCYSMVIPSGKLGCYPSINTLPEIQEFQSGMASSHQESDSDLSQLIRRKNLAYFHILIEAHIIRELKTRLGKFQ